MPTLKILAVDDDKTIQRVLQQAFPKALFNLHFAMNGEEALKEYQSFMPDIILLDILMPVLNGYETLKTIRGQHQDLTTTIIMLSSITAKSEIMACAKLGIQGYIFKPFAAKDLALQVVKYHKNNSASK